MLKIFHAVLLVAVWMASLTVQAATVTGTIVDRTGTPYKAGLSFLALSRPTFAPGEVRPGVVVKTNSATNGTFIVNLLAGLYKTSVGNDSLDVFNILVPATGGPYTIDTLTTNLASYSTAVSNVFIGATSTNAGRYGLVPTPQIVDRAKYLNGSGAWSDVVFPFGANITNANLLGPVRHGESGYVTTLGDGQSLWFYGSYGDEFQTEIAKVNQYGIESDFVLRGGNGGGEVLMADSVGKIKGTGHPVADYALVNYTTNAIKDATNGVNALAKMKDASIAAPADNQVLKYNSAAGKWINAPSENPTNFSFVVIPDSQYPVLYNNGEMELVVSWITNHIKEYNIQQVLTEGDLLNTATNLSELTLASNAMQTLVNAGLPVTIAMGNHDHDDYIATSTATNWSAYFPKSWFTENLAWHGGFQNSSNAIGQYTLQTNGVHKFIFIGMELANSNSTLAWMDSILNTYSNHSAIIACHQYIFADSHGADFSFYGGKLSGLNIWDQCLSKHPNVLAVWGGHYHGTGYPGDYGRQNSVGLYGNVVHEALQSPAWSALSIQICTFDLTKNKMIVKTYIPSRDEWIYRRDATYEDTLFQSGGNYRINLAGNTTNSNPSMEFSLMESNHLQQRWFLTGKSNRFDLAWSATKEANASISPFITVETNGNVWIGTNIIGDAAYRPAPTFQPANNNLTNWAAISTNQVYFTNTPLTINGGSHSTYSPQLKLTEIYNNAGVIFETVIIDVTNIASGDLTRPFVIRMNGTNLVEVDKAGQVIAAGKPLVSSSSGNATNLNLFGNTILKSSSGTALAINTDQLVLTNGNFGIGTTNPQAQVDIYSKFNTPVTQRLSGYAGADRGVVGSIDFFNYVPNSSNIQGQIKVLRGAGNYKSGQLGFFTSAPGTGTLSERITIDESGNVGIGTTNPETALHVIGTIRSTSIQCTNLITAEGSFGMTTSKTFYCWADAAMTVKMTNTITIRNGISTLWTNP